MLTTALVILCLYLFRPRRPRPADGPGGDGGTMVVSGAMASYEQIGRMVLVMKRR